MDRRNFSRLLASVAGCVATNQAFGGVYSPTSFIPATWASQAAAMPTMARYPQKTDLILLTDRPPQLETPLRYFETDLTPNDAFFVRWHLPGIPTAVDTRTYRLEVSGSLSKPQSLSLRDLQTKFPPVSYVALCQCAGNSRSFFEPRVAGGQWGFGAMSNARWKGARLKDVLAVAGVGQGTIQVAFRGLDTAPLPQTPRYEKSLPIDRAMDGEVILAYEMNGAPLPMLNGFPLRVIVPGWYATYWVKSVSAITVLDKPLKTFWMDTAYRIPDNPRAEETPQSLAPKTVPMSTMSVHSIFVRPTATEQLRAGQAYILRGVATDGGSGIARVEVSTDQGKSWSEASLGSDLGNYSWRLWQMEWTPPSAGNYQLQVRAISKDGQQQVTSQWNRSGYQRDVVEHVDVRVI